jgi:hypothetical protein
METEIETIPLYELPRDTILKVFAYLNVHGLFQISMVNHDYNQLIHSTENDEVIWKTLFVNTFPNITNGAVSTWKQHFRDTSTLGWNTSDSFELSNYNRTATCIRKAEWCSLSSSRTFDLSVKPNLCWDFVLDQFDPYNIQPPNHFSVIIGFQCTKLCKKIGSIHNPILGYARRTTTHIHQEYGFICGNYHAVVNEGFHDLKNSGSLNFPDNDRLKSGDVITFRLNYDKDTNKLYTRIFGPNGKEITESVCPVLTLSDDQQCITPCISMFNRYVVSLKLRESSNNE